MTCACAQPPPLTSHIILHQDFYLSITPNFFALTTQGPQGPTPFDRVWVDMVKPFAKPGPVPRRVNSFNSRYKTLSYNAMTPPVGIDRLQLFKTEQTNVTYRLGLFRI